MAGPPSIFSAFTASPPASCRFRWLACPPPAFPSWPLSAPGALPGWAAAAPPSTQVAAPGWALGLGSRGWAGGGGSARSASESAPPASCASWPGSLTPGGRESTAALWWLRSASERSPTTSAHAPNRKAAAHSRVPDLNTLYPLSRPPLDPNSASSRHFLSISEACTHPLRQDLAVPVPLGRGRVDVAGRKGRRKWEAARVCLEGGDSHLHYCRRG